MVKNTVLALTLTSCLLLAGGAQAQPPGDDCLVGPGMAATLLFPYFEVNLTTSAGVTTLLAINNGFAFPALTRVILWTDWGVPTVAFDLYLNGFDVQTINLRDVFNGIIPSTGAGADLSGFDFCDSLPPTHSNPVLTVDERNQARADHTGQLGPLAGDCAGEPTGDQIARGYVTVDVVDECSGVEGFAPIFTPANTAYPYFADGGGASGIATTDNVLWGDVIYVDPAGNAAQANEAIAVWADSGKFSGTDTYTFYGRFSNWDARDDRVPLPALWNQRFINGGPFAGGATLVVWRDTAEPVETALCGSHPTWWPLPATAAAVDEDAGNLFNVSGGPFGLAARRVDVTALGIPYPFGWIQIDPGGQAWVQPTLTGAGVFSAAFNGFPNDFLCGVTPP